MSYYYYVLVQSPILKILIKLLKYLVYYSRAVGKKLLTTVRHKYRMPPVGRAETRYNNPKTGEF